MRFGTPAATTRGMKEPEMQKIAGFITEILRNAQSDKAVSKVREEVLAFTAKFPVP
jgi:glycine hydroxymethyltransferase